MRPSLWLPKFLMGWLVCISTPVASSWPSDIPKNKPYPTFGVGVTGISVNIAPEHQMFVQQVEEDSPASGVLRPGDQVLAVNGRSIEGEDPRVPLGEALTQAEARGGRLVFRILRDQREQRLTVRIPVLGPYADRWPLDCKKSRSIVRAAADRLIQSQDEAGRFGTRGNLGVTGCLSALFLLSTGEEESLRAVQRFVQALVTQTLDRPSQSIWNLGYQGILLGEYFLRTGDRQVLPALETICQIAADHQIAGAWAHNATTTAVGYVQSGQMNSAGVTMFQALALARECGVSVSEDAFQRSLVFFYRMVGHGCICYGDHRAEIFADTNGRNACIAAAFALLSEEPYVGGATHLARMVADSYFGHELGHTGGGFNVIWRGIALPLLPQECEPDVRRHMDQLAWYYDLCRRADGGFRLLPSAPSGETRYTGEDWGAALGLTYTAPRRTLRITGAPRTRFSSTTPPLFNLPWGTGRDRQFLDWNHAAGMDSNLPPPHVSYRSLTGKPAVAVAEAANFLRHYNPVFRTWAAAKLGALRSEEAYAAIETAVRDPDPRVRRAGADAISAYTNWHRSGQGSGIPPEVVSKRFVPSLESMLKDPDAAWWEIDGALWALGQATPADIRRNMETIRRFASHSEWYLRESAFWAVVGLGTDITGEEFLLLIDQFAASERVFERSSYDGGIRFLLQRRKIVLPETVVAESVRRLGKASYQLATAAGYDEMAARHEAVHRVMMVLKRFPAPPYELIVQDLATYLENWSPDYQHSAWLIIGSKWQPGLVAIAKEIGEEAGPLIEAFQQCLDRTEWKDHDKTHQSVKGALEAAVARQ